MALLLAVIASLPFGSLVAPAAEISNEVAQASRAVGTASNDDTSTLRAERRALDRVSRKFLRGRMSAKVAARRIADLLDRQGSAEAPPKEGRLVVGTGERRMVTNNEAIYGVLFQAESVDEQAKIAELMDELTRVLKVRARLRPRP